MSEPQTTPTPEPGTRSAAFLAGFIDGYREAVSTDRILHRIDAVVEARCACGCPQPITADSPSAYYASPACQQRWMSQHVDNPQAVYGRPDAVVYPERYDDLDPPTPQPLLARVLLYGPDTFPTRLAYTVHCDHCDTRAAPYVCRTGDGVLIADCSHCDAQLPDPVCLPDLVERADGTVEFILSTDELRTTHTVYTTHGLVGAHIWEILERRLTRFGRRWTGPARRQR